MRVLFCVFVFVFVSFLLRCDSYIFLFWDISNSCTLVTAVCAIQPTAAVMQTLKRDKGKQTTVTTSACHSCFGFYNKVMIVEVFNHEALLLVHDHFTTASLSGDSWI